MATDPLQSHFGNYFLAATLTRRKKIGDLGEDWTKHLLRNSGFRSIQDLNKLRYNHPGGDFLAERGKKKYFITVKARNKYVQASRRLNSGYNIYPEKVRRAAEQYGAVPAWLTIQIDTDRRCYSAYFGTIESLRNPNAVAVPMTPKAVGDYECLANEKFDPAITADLSNQLSRRHFPHSLRKANEERSYSSEYDQIAVEQLGFQRGTKTQRAVAMYLRPNGATTAEVAAVNGGPYLNCLKKVEELGHHVVRSKIADPKGHLVTSYKIVLK